MGVRPTPRRAASRTAWRARRRKGEGNGGEGREGCSGWRQCSERCAERVGGEEGIARFMGTASVARDMLEIAQKMGQEKVQYWGFVSVLFALVRGV